MSKFEIKGKICITDALGVPLYEEDNLFVNKGFEVIASLFAREFGTKGMGFIQLGTGGDAATVGGTPGASRVAPAESDEEIRLLLFEKAILNFSKPDDNTVRFETFLQSFEGNSTDINEFALVTQDKTMVSHVVTVETGPGGPATKIAKNAGQVAGLAWELTTTRCP